MSYSFTTAKQIIYGENAIEKSVDALKNFGKKALVVTGKNVSKLDCFELLINMLSENGIKSVVFDEITGEPDDKMIIEGAEKYKSEKCDFLIGFGGGSPIDSMKAIAVIVKNGGKIADYMGKEISAHLPPMAAYPTTAGTGSEVTKFTVITDSATQIKMLLKGECLIPDLAVIDVRASISSPKKVTAATALDALTHAVESYTSRKSQPMTDTLSVSAVKRIFKYLPDAFTDGNDLKARSELSIAALEAGMSINNASVTLVHGMSRPIGALFHVPHGISNAMLLEKCMEFAKSGVSKKLAQLAREIGVAGYNTSDDLAADKFVESLGKLCRLCEIPTLYKYGVDRDEFFANVDKMADDALASGSPSNTVCEVTKDDILRIYRNLWI